MDQGYEAHSHSLVSLTFDDGLRCQFEHAIPILDQLGLSATFFLVANTDPIHTDGCKHPDWRKANWSVEDIRFLKGMLQQGHEIGAHSVHHREPFLSHHPKAEAEESKRWIEQRLETDVSSYCYPFCRVTPRIRDSVIGAGYKQARGGAHGSYYSSRDSIDYFNVDCRHVSKDRPEYVGGHPVGRDGVEQVCDWLRPSHWHVLMFHGIGTVHDGWWSISVAEFTRQMTELARYRDDGKVEVVTFKHGAERLTQVV